MMNYWISRSQRGRSPELVDSSIRTHQTGNRHTVTTSKAKQRERWPLSGQP